MLSRLPPTDLQADPQLKKVQRLRVLLKLMLGVGFMAIVYVSFSTGFSGSSKIPDLPSLRVELSQITQGNARQLLWENRPVIIVHRTPEQVDALAHYTQLLRDPDSAASVQPPVARNRQRSVTPVWFVALAYGTDLGCSLTYIPGVVKTGSAELVGAFKDSCRGSVYDLAGRVLRGQQAEQNLVVPDYQLNDLELLLGAK